MKVRSLIAIAAVALAAADADAGFFRRGRCRPAAACAPQCGLVPQHGCTPQYGFAGAANPVVQTGGCAGGSCPLPR